MSVAFDAAERANCSTKHFPDSPGRRGLPQKAPLNHHVARGRSAADPLFPGATKIAGPLGHPDAAFREDQKQVEKQ